MTTWHKLTDGYLPPVYQENPCDKWTSKPVLAFTTYGNILIATLEQWEDIDVPEWFSNCSDHWSLGDTVTHWAELPEGPRE